jgi:hypothetical protein
MLVGLIVATVAIPSAVLADGIQGAFSPQFQATLTGAEEVPPVVTIATGDAQFELSTNGLQIRYQLEYQDIEGAFMGHIHLENRGKNGNVVVWLCGGFGKPDCPVTGGTLSGVITASDFKAELAGKPMSALVAEMRAGRTYANVHTRNSPHPHPAGEIRGQIHGTAE